jgi:hypothetical protein
LSSRGLKRPEKGYGVMTDEDRQGIKSCANNYEINKEEGISGSTINPIKIIHQACKRQEQELMEEVTA